MPQRVRAPQRMRLRDRKWNCADVEFAYALVTGNLLTGRQPGLDQGQLRGSDLGFSHLRDWGARSVSRVTVLHTEGHWFKSSAADRLSKT